MDKEMLISSEYYEANLTVTKKTLHKIYNMYINWCAKNFSKPEVTRSDFLENPEQYIDHILYHAEIYDPDKVNEFLTLNAHC